MEGNRLLVHMHSVIIHAGTPTNVLLHQSYDDIHVEAQPTYGKAILFQA